TLPSMRVVRAFGREGYEIGRYGGAVERSFLVGLASGRLSALFVAAMTGGSLLATTAVLWFGGHQVLAGHLTPGGLIAFIFYLGMLTGPMQSLAVVYNQLQQAGGGATRVFQILDTQPAVVDRPDAYPLPPVRGDLEIADLWFTYGVGSDRYVLQGVNLRAG